MFLAGVETLDAFIAADEGVDVLGKFDGQAPSRDVTQGSTPGAASDVTVLRRSLRIAGAPAVGVAEPEEELRSIT